MLTRTVFIASMLLAAIVATVWGATTAQAGGGCHQAPTDAETTTVEIEGVCFGPTIVRVAPGDTVTWINHSSMAHTVTGVNMSWGDYSAYAGGESVSQRFAEAGVYPYFCLLHPGMTGAVVVGDGAGAGASVESVAARPLGAERAAQPAAVERGSDGPPVALIIAGALVGSVAVAGTGGFVLGRRRDENS